MLDNILYYISAEIYVYVRKVVVSDGTKDSGYNYVVLKYLENGDVSS
jgi:hypothetical protein